MVFFTLSSDDGPEEPIARKGRNQYMSKRDIVLCLIALVALILIVMPLFTNGVRQSQEARCRQNLRAIGQAMLLYSAGNDDRLTPTYNMEDDKSPALVGGMPVTWATQIHPYMTARNDLLCPSAKPEELVESVSGNEKVKSTASSYGMYRGLSSASRIQIPDPGTSIMIAETSNNGALGTSDPTPFGNGKPDGFLISWDDDNLMFTKTSKTVTRLSFWSEKAGDGSTVVVGRHGPHVNAISVDGSLKILLPSDTKVQHSPPRLAGMWWADPNLFR